MPTAARISIVKLRKWFPPDDPLAAKIARLCILREDLLLEMQGVYTEEIQGLDEHSSQFRRLYFLRNLIRTQIELSGALQVLLSTPEFKVLLGKASKDIQDAFHDATAVIAKAHSVTKDVRNDICGHVRELAVQAAIDRIDPEAWGFLSVGKIAKHTHYKFVGELIAEILLKDVSLEERQKIESSKFATIAEFVELFALIEHCVLLYVEDRRLLPR
jgi:hypothetical protein